jgi:4-carboxymuconolactone decarboxylase
MSSKEQTHRETLEAGLQKRRQVLGADHVARSLEQTSEFARPIQELVTEYCWGEIWTNEALPAKTRSLVNLAMLTALNRGHELAVHVRGAINNGASVTEIQGVLMQTAVYVGVPAALESFRIAETTLRELGRDV